MSAMASSKAFVRNNAGGNIKIVHELKGSGYGNHLQATQHQSYKRALTGTAHETRVPTKQKQDCVLCSKSAAGAHVAGLFSAEFSL